MCTAVEAVTVGIRGSGAKEVEIEDTARLGQSESSFVQSMQPESLMLLLLCYSHF